MSTLRMVQVGITAAQAAIDTAGQYPDDLDAAQLRVGVLAFLHSHAVSAPADPGSENLLAAYHDWLDTATSLFSTGDSAMIREYMRRGGILGAEVEISTAYGTAPAVTP